MGFEAPIRRGRRAMARVALLWALAAPAWAQGVAWHPAQGQRGTLLFEDLYPCQGDRDFNDVVLTYNVAVTDDGVRDTGFAATIAVRAHGASRCAGIAWHLPTTTGLTATVRRGTPGSADGRPWGEPQPVSITWDGGEPTLLLSPDIRADLGGGAEGFVNTEAGDTVEWVPLLVEGAFASDPGLAGVWPFDLHIFGCGDPTAAVRLPGYPAGPLAGTCDSDPLDPFVSDAGAPVDGLPWALSLPEDPDVHPLERTRIEAAWPDLLDFLVDDQIPFWRTPAPGTVFDAAPLATPATPPLDAFDLDGDGFCVGWDHDGLPATPPQCAVPAQPFDCDDAHPGRSPGQPEVWYDGFDADCGFDDDYDQDGDGVRAYPEHASGGDCDDATSATTDCGTTPGTALDSCAHLLAVNPHHRWADATYYIDPSGAPWSDPFPVSCDMSDDGGGWTLVARVHDGSTGAHRTRSAVGTLTSRTQTTTAKLSDADINLLRGDSYNDGLIRMWGDLGGIDYFRQNREFNAVGNTSSINRVFNAYTPALNQTGECFGTYNTTYHTGLVGWDCHDHCLYGDNPGFRLGDNYQGGTVWVKDLFPLD